MLKYKSTKQNQFTLFYWNFLFLSASEETKSYYIFGEFCLCFPYAHESRHTQWQNLAKITSSLTCIYCLVRKAVHCQMSRSHGWGHRGPSRRRLHIKSTLAGADKANWNLYTYRHMSWRNRIEIAPSASLSSPWKSLTSSRVSWSSSVGRRRRHPPGPRCSRCRSRWRRSRRTRATYQSTRCQHMAREKSKNYIIAEFPSQWIEQIKVYNWFPFYEVATILHFRGIPREKSCFIGFKSADFLMKTSLVYLVEQNVSMSPLLQGRPDTFIYTAREAWLMYLAARVDQAAPNHDVLLWIFTHGWKNNWAKLTDNSWRVKHLGLTIAH